jgi:hypothetical protein
MTVRTFQFTVQAPLVDVPRWASSAPLWQWVTIPATSTLLAKMDAANPGGAKPFIYSYSSAALHPDTLDLYVMGGGHADYAGNEVYKLGLNSEAPVWTRLSTPTQPSAGSLYPGGTSLAGAAYYWDGLPTSRHTWQQLWVIPQRNALMTFGAGAVWGNGNGSFANVDAWSLTTNDYVIPSPYANAPMASPEKAFGCVDADRNYWIQYPGGSSYIYKWTQATATWSFVSNGRPHVEGHGCYDSTRNRMVRLPSDYGGGPYMGEHWSCSGALDKQDIPYTSLSFGDRRGVAWYDAGLDRIVFMCTSAAAGASLGRFVWLIHPTTFAATRQDIGGVVPEIGSQEGIYFCYRRFHYVEALRGFVFLSQAGSPAYFMRTS